MYHLDRKSLDTLIANLEKTPLSESMISQYFPARKFGELAAGPRQLLADHIKMSLARYYTACGWG